MKYYIEIVTPWGTFRWRLSLRAPHYFRDSSDQQWGVRVFWQDETP